AEGPQVSPDAAESDVPPPGAALRPLQHRRGVIATHDVMAVLRARHRDAAGAAAELQDRPARTACETGEPLHVRAGFDRPGGEVVQGGEARSLAGVAFHPLPVTTDGRCVPPSRP